MYKTFFLALLLIIHVSPQCSIQPINGINAGSIELNSFSSSEDQFTHNFKRRFSSIPNFAFGIWDLSYFNFGTSNVLKLRISDAVVTNFNVKFTIQSQPGEVWRKVKIGYMSSTRSEITVGTAHFGSNSITGRSVRHQVTGLNIVNYKKAIIRAFINGFTLQKSGRQYDVKVVGNSIEQTKISVLISSGSQTTLTDLWYSYVVFSPSQVPFASYGGGIVENNYLGTQYRDIHNLVHYPEYILAGFTELKFELTFSFRLQVDNDLVLMYRVDDNFISFSFAYILIGIPPRMLCNDCPGKYPFENKCVDACPEESYYFTYRDRGIGCHNCSIKLLEVLNSQRSGCDCIPGFARTKEGRCEQIVPEFNPNPTPVSPTPTPTPTPTPSNPTPIDPIDAKTKCISLENSYWTGYSCVCKVGYRLNQNSGTCTKIVIVPPPQPECRQKTEYFNGKTCQCLPNHQRINGTCLIISCSANETFIDGKCVCRNGYVPFFDGCVLKCPQNSYRSNTTKLCTCFPGYTETSQGACEKQQCPLANMYEVDGKCICLPGYQEYNGKCLRCEPGQIWDQNKCVKPCKINQNYNPLTQQCECQAGFTYIQILDSCEKIECQPPFFLKDNFCATCPLNKYYNNSTMQCVCDSLNGYQSSSNGQCIKKCDSTSQIYDQNLQQCRCFNGLGRIDGKCTTCPGGSTPDPNTQICAGCGTNQRFQGATCVCISGYGKNSQNQCIKCQNENLINIDGYCGLCSINRQWNGNSCVCKPGAQQIDGVCVQQCTEGQLVDANGLCYYCPLTEMVQDNTCVCRDGYQRNSNGICEKLCQNGKHLIKGQCGTCVLGSVYDPVNGECICKAGYYRNNFGFCEKSTLTPTPCQDGFYYKQNEGCTPCAEGCKTCTSTSCTACISEFYEPRETFCSPICGDGKIIRPQEECDDSNTRVGDGCNSTCQQERGFFCNGEPSVCTGSTPQPQQCGNGVKDSNEGCDDGNQNNNDGCSSNCVVESGYICNPVCKKKESFGMQLVGNVETNNKNVHMKIRTDRQFSFSSETEMRDFMKFQFEQNSTPTWASCSQELTNKQLFNCLFIYPSGVPNYAFIINLFYSRNGYSGNLDVSVDTSRSFLSFRALV